MSKYKILEVWYQELFIIRPWNWGLLFGPVWVPANIWQVYHFSQFQYTLSIRFFLTFLQVFGNAVMQLQLCGKCFSKWKGKSRINNFFVQCFISLLFNFQSFVSRMNMTNICLVVFQHMFIYSSYAFIWCFLVILLLAVRKWCVLCMY